MNARPASQGPVVSAGQMRARLAALNAAPRQQDPPPSEVGRSRWRLRQRVVLLDGFTVGALDPDARAEGSHEVQEFIAGDCELATTRSGTAWRLALGVRRETLARLGPREALVSASAPDAVPPAPDDVTCRMARLLLQDTPDLGRLSPSELSGVLRAHEWLVELPLALPGEAEIKRALDMANVLAPLRVVARADFVGRDAELAMLDEFIRSPEPGPEPLAIHGPGGIGKSALVARFVLDHVDGDGERLRFAYLTFDRAELDPQYPLTLVREMVRQLALQSPATAGQAAGIIQDIDRQLAADMALREEAIASRGNRALDARKLATDQVHFISRYAKLVDGAGGPAPFLVVLDTFEVAQRRRRSSLSILDSALRELAARMPQLRVVIAGRAEASELTGDQRALHGLSADQARDLLRRALAGLTISDDLITDVVARVSGNPLSLRLAAELMRREGESALASPTGRRRFLFGLRAEQIQGILYRRILDHIDVALRPLANPGLVVRRITPAVIAEVLSTPCGLGDITPAEAQGLFERLRAEVSLVTEGGPDTLIHRADVRQEMLPLLQAESPELVEDIHHRAIAYYQGRTALDDRTEHLYHRLMLGQSSETLDGYWDLFAGSALETAMPELPASARVYLAGKLPDHEVDRADLAAADHAAWVGQVTRQARRLLDSERADGALALIDERDGPGGADAPAVVLLRIEALASLGRRAEALTLAREAVDNADAKGLAREYIDLSVIAARVAEDMNDLRLSGDYFSRARESARDVGARVASLTAGAGVLRTIRRSGVLGSRSASHRLRQELIAEAATLTEREKAKNPGLLRELAAELGGDLPQLLADAALHLGVETTSKGDNELSRHARETIDNTIREQRAASGADDDPADERDGDAPPLGSAAAGAAIAEALQHAPDDADLHETVQEYWVSEADLPSF